MRYCKRRNNRHRLFSISFCSCLFFRIINHRLKKITSASFCAYTNYRRLLNRSNFCRKPLTQFVLSLPIVFAASVVSRLLSVHRPYRLKFNTFHRFYRPRPWASTDPSTGTDLLVRAVCYIYIYMRSTPIAGRTWKSKRRHRFVVVAAPAAQTEQPIIPPSLTDGPLSSPCGFRCCCRVPPSPGGRPPIIKTHQSSPRLCAFCCALGPSAAAAWSTERKNVASSGRLLAAGRSSAPRVRSGAPPLRSLNAMAQLFCLSFVVLGALVD